jgi:protein gp37
MKMPRDWQDRIAPHMNELQGWPRNHYRNYIPWPLPNVWLGTSVENQKCSDERIPHLRRCPAIVHFLSVEPQIGEIDFSERPGRKRGKELDNIQWVIQGGESGGKARPFDVEWARSIRDECAAAGVAYFLKQLGAKPIIGRTHETEISVVMKDSHGGDMDEWPVDLRVRQFPKEAPHARP